MAPEWGWAWPANRRILYNRASADPDGKPWSERKRYVWWDEDDGEVDRLRRPRLPRRQARPTTRRPTAPAGDDAIAGGDPFIMKADGRGWLFAPTGLLDGPLPTHYEPHESPVANPLYGQQANPARHLVARARTPTTRRAAAAARSATRSCVTTYRLTEHHTAGGMWRSAAVAGRAAAGDVLRDQPGARRARGLEHGGWVTIVTHAGGDRGARAGDRADRAAARRRAGTIHQIGLPYHWGYRGLVTGDAANDLFPLVVDPNVRIQEVKAATCDVRPGRRPRGPALPPLRRRSTSRTATEAGAVSDPTCERRPGPAPTATRPSRAWASSPTRRVCIGCKACEVACKEWNDAARRTASCFTGQSYDNTGELGATTWRHVAFVEQERPLRVPNDVRRAATCAG